MTKMMKKVANGVKTMASRATGLVRDKKGENYVDTAVKILIAVVLGALLLAGLLCFFSEMWSAHATQRVQEMFNYAGRNVHRHGNSYRIGQFTERKGEYRCSEK